MFAREEEADEGHPQCKSETIAKALYSQRLSLEPKERRESGEDKREFRQGFECRMIPGAELGVGHTHARPEVPLQSYPSRIRRRILCR